MLLLTSIGTLWVGHFNLCCQYDIITDAVEAHSCGDQFLEQNTTGSDRSTAGRFNPEVFDEPGQVLATPLTLEPSIRSNLTSPHPLLLFLPHLSQLFTSCLCNSHVL